MDLLKKTRQGLASLLALPLAFVGSCSSLREDALPANNLYVERVKKEQEKKFERWSEEMDRTGKSNDLLLVDNSLDETISSLGYSHLRSNVSSLDEAQLVCLGDVHTTCGDELSIIFSDKFVGKKDKFLIEASPPYFRDISSGQKDLLTLFDSFKDAENGMEFLSYLYRANKGVVIGADADRSTKIGQLYSAVESAILPLYISAIPNKDRTHPFLEWLAFEAIQATDCSLSPAEKLDSIKSYVSKIPSSEEHMKKRDEQIAGNVVREVSSCEKGQRAWYIFGAKHLNETLFGALENKGIKYIAFTPQIEQVYSEGNKEDLGREYYVNKLLPWYVSEKVADGRLPYTGTFEGLLK